jgi:hypothetical protein
MTDEISKAGRTISKTLMDALSGDGDLILAPWMIRKHLFRWGLTNAGGRQASGDFIFDRDETTALLDRNTPTYRSALLDGRLLRRTPNAEALFLLSNSRRWDKALRDGLTSQLDSHEGRASLAALIVPPGHGVERATLDALFDADVVKARMEAAGEGGPETSWSGGCLRRLMGGLNRTDTEFGGDT